MKDSIKYNYYLFRILLKNSPLRIFAGLFITLFDVIINVLFNVIFLTYLVDSISSGADFKTVFYFILFVMGLVILNSIFEKIYSFRIVPISDKIISKAMQTIIYNKIKDIDLACFDNPEFFNEYILSLNEILQRTINTWEIINSFIRNILTALVMMFYVVTFDTITIIFSIIPIIISVVISLVINKINFDFKTKMLPKERKEGYIQRVFYLQDYTKELRMFDISKVLVQKFKENTDEEIAIIKKFSYKRTAMYFIQDNAQMIFGYMAMVIYLCYKIIIQKTLSVGNFVGLLNAVNNFTFSISSLFNIVPQFNENAIYAKKIYSLLNYENTVKNGDKPIPSLAAGYTLEFKNVSFRYTDESEYVLKNINMSIKSGENIALVGINGAGKTTIVKLILRFYDPTSGDIFLNGQNIKSFPLEEYRKIFSVVLQDFQIFACEVCENVLMRNTKPEDEKNVLESLFQSQLNINDIHLNVTKEFDDNGLVLSGGQKQKLAISRIFANKDKNILILDEPSSSLDPVSEYHIYKEIYEKYKDKTKIFISHRLSTTIEADCIYLLNQGKIIEKGTHSQLINLNGEYAKMYNMQAEKYKEKRGGTDEPWC